MLPGDVLRASNLGLVVRAGAGYNTIDVKTASERGIYVSNCPGKNSIAVAELTMALILALDRHVADGAADLRAGTWNKAKYGKARGLHGRTLAVLGVGNIGKEVARRATCFVRLCFQRHLRMPCPPAETVAGKVVGDGIEPGGELLARIEP